MKKLQFFITLALAFGATLSASQAWSTMYYIGPNGSDSNGGKSSASPWRTFNYADTKLQPGDTLIILDGTYNQHLITTNSGNTTGGYITYKAQHDFEAILAPTTDIGRATIDVFSCPGCGGGHDNPVQEYLKFEGIVARGIGENSVISLYSRDDASESIMTNHITVKNCGFYGSAQETNTSVMDLGINLRDSLIEDVFAYGRGRKAISVFGSRRITVRRAVARYDYWEGDDYKPNDPRVNFTGYNAHDCIFENIIAIDSAPDPSGTSPDRSGVAVEGNDTPGGLSNSENNKYLGIVILNNYGNGIESDSGASVPNRHILMENILIWNSHDRGGGLDVHGNDDSSIYKHMTIGRHEDCGVRINQYPGHPITNDTLANIFSLDNNLLGFHYGSSQVSNFVNNTSVNNDEGDDREVSYAPNITSRFLDPIMAAGHPRGAVIVKRYVDGVLTNTPLWPYPNEQVIKQFMCNSDDLQAANRIASMGEDWEPGWCATDKSLTEYIWEFNGASCPNDICTAHTIAPRILTLLLSE